MAAPPDMGRCLVRFVGLFHPSLGGRNSHAETAGNTICGMKHEMEFVEGLTTAELDRNDGKNHGLWDIAESLGVGHHAGFCENIYLWIRFLAFFSCENGKKLSCPACCDPKADAFLRREVWPWMCVEEDHSPCVEAL